MRLEIVGGREVRLVGGDDRQMVVVSKIEQERLDGPLLRQAVPLQLDIEPVAENAFQLVEGCFGKSEIVGGDGAVDHAVRAAGQRDEPLLVERKVSDRDQRLAAVGAVAIGLGRKLDEIGVTARILGEERDAAVIDVLHELAAVRARLGLGREAQGERAADDGLDLGLRRVFGEFERAEQIVGVGQRERRHALFRGKADQLRNGQRAFEQRIGRMHPKMHEGLLSARHGMVSPSDSGPH